MAQIKTKNFAGFGLRNRNYPVWEYGARWFWRPNGADDVVGDSMQHRGGRTALTVSYAGASDYCYWDPGKGQYIRQDPGVAVIIPKDGRFSTQRTNYYDNNDDLVSRSLVLDGALTGSTPATGTTHIYPIIGTRFRITNSSGAARRAYQDNATSATLKSIWSFLVKRTDGGVIDVTVLTPIVWDSGAGAFTGPQIATDINYKKIRGDGWYEVQCVVAAIGGAPSRRYGVEIATGYAVDFELPQIETGSASYVEATDRIPTTSAVNRIRYTFDLDYEVSTAMSMAMPTAGWMGCSFVPRWSNAGGPAIVASTLLEIVDAGGTNFHRLYWSAASQVFTYWCQTGGVTQAFLALPTTTEGETYGFVATWGSRKGSNYFFACTNGEFTEIDTAGAPPEVGAAVVDLNLGTSAGTAPANCQVAALAMGDQALQRQDVRYLSRWFQTVTESNIG